MRSLVLFTLILSISYCRVINAQTTNISTAESIVEKAIKYTPHKGTKQGLKTYKEIVFGKQEEAYENDQYVAASNSGIETYINKSLEDNACLKSKVVQFIGEIKKLDVTYIQQDSPLSGRPSHLDTAGSGKFKDLKPGFLWELALDISDQNPNLAIRLLGACGHDDYQTNTFQHEGSDVCPQGSSVLYLSKALGEEQDISRKLREKIITTQAPTKGGAYLPSKNYHIIGAAFLSCLMIEKGAFPAVASAISKNSAAAYRTIRIDNQVHLLLNDRERKIESYKKAKGRDISFSTYISTVEGEPETLPFYDAAILFKKFNFGGEKLPNLHIKNLRLPDFLKTKPFHDGLEQWSPERYNEAKRLYNSWMLDYKWTVKQHEIGSKFAAKKCKKAIVDPSFSKECSDISKNCDNSIVFEKELEQTTNSTSDILEKLKKGDNFHYSPF